MWFLILWIGLFIVGYLIIFFSADFFIDNLKDLCIIYNVSPFIIGLIVLGIDPEESIASIVAAINGLPYIAVGNVIGNSIISLTLCFALPAFIYKIDLKSVSLFYYIVLYICMVLIVLGCLFNFGLLVTGILAIGVYLIYLIRSLKHLFKEKTIGIIDMVEIFEEIEEDKEELEKKSKSKKIIMICLSLLFIILGGELLIISAEQIIIITLLPETFFGFIIIAFVTNVEELTLVFKSIKKKSIEIGLGGMIGKIIWNLAFTFGVSGVISLSIGFNLNIIWNWLILLILIVYFNLISRTKSLRKKEASILLCIFLVFIVVNIVTMGG